MTTPIRRILLSASPLFVAFALSFPMNAAQACDGKSCPHHAKSVKCECSCKGKGKDHKCGTESCEKAKCDAKGCCHENHKHQDEPAQKT